MDRAQKEAMVAMLREELTTTPGIVVASGAGMPVNTMNELRAELRKSGSKFRVVKNTLAKIAIEGTDVEVLSEHLTGPTALAYHPEDPAAAAKVIVKFKKDNDKFVVRAGYVGGTIVDEMGVEAMSKMLGKDELRSKLLSLLTAVHTKFVGTLVAGPRNFVMLLNARKNDLEEAA